MMDRNHFLKICGGGCLAMMGLSLLGSSAAATPYLLPDDEKNKLLPVSKELFIKVKKNTTTYRPFIIVTDGPYDFPIALYRFGDDEYAALLMRCTHQGNELNAYGELLSCSAHGSEFDTCGAVITGPAETELQTFQITTDETTIYIHLL